MVPAPATFWCAGGCRQAKAAERQARAAEVAAANAAAGAAPRPALPVLPALQSPGIAQRFCIRLKRRLAAAALCLHVLLPDSSGGPVPPPHIAPPTCDECGGLCNPGAGAGRGQGGAGRGARQQHPRASAPAAPPAPVDDTVRLAFPPRAKDSAHAALKVGPPLSRPPAAAHALYNISI